jgi:hypothetical protein
MIFAVASFSICKEGGRLAQYQRTSGAISFEEPMRDGGQARRLTARMAACAGMNDLSRVASEMFERPVEMARGKRQ